MWEGMTQCIRRSAGEVVGVSRGGGGRKVGTWWWNEEVREKVKEKQKAYAALSSCTSEEEKGERDPTYKDAKKLAKKAVAIANNNAYERLYHKLETKEGEKRCVQVGEGQRKEVKGPRMRKMY